MNRTKLGNEAILTDGVIAHFAIGGAIFLALLGVEWLLGILGLIGYQAVLAVVGVIFWILSNLEKVPTNHCAIKLWLGGRVEVEPGKEELDISGEGLTIKWPFGLVTWMPYPTGQQVIHIGTAESPFAVQSGSFKLVKDDNQKLVVIRKDGSEVTIDSNKGAIYLHVALTVTYHVSSHRILDYPDLKEAESAVVAVITALVRDVVLREERTNKAVIDPAMICERKDIVEEEVDHRAKGLVEGKDPLDLPNPGQDEDGELNAERNMRPKKLLDNIGVEIESIKIRKIDPDPEMIKAIQQQKIEELGATSRKTEADGVVDRIQEYKDKLGINPYFGAIVDLAAEALNIHKGGGKK